MEYSKEDLMEAKRQILGVGENMGTEESKKIWEKNAQFWDNAMGDESNEFHREVVRPKVTELLSPNPADYILDIACGNGNYSSYLAQRGASVVAFDYSKKMIELAKRRRSQYAKQIEFCVADATNRESLLGLKRNRAFTKAVSNMAIMDITDIEPLFMAVYELLEEKRLETVHRSRGKACFERGVEPCPEIPLYRNKRSKGHAYEVWKERQDPRPVHAGTGKSPYAARRGYRLGNARYLRRALRYAPF